MATLRITTIQDNGYRRGEYTFDGQILDGCSADVEPGVSIRIFGTYANHVDGPQPFDRTFKLGDECEYDSYNLRYTGRIVGIGPRSIVVEDRGRRRRLTIYAFTWRNWDFDSVAIAKHNKEEFRHI
jgi:hypothetical protein